VAGNADLVVGGRHPDREANDLATGAVSRCMISESANGSNCGVCSEGTLSDSVIDKNLRIRRIPGG